MYFSSIHAAYRAHLIPDFNSLIIAGENCTLSGLLGPRLRGYVPQSYKIAASFKFLSFCILFLRIYKAETLIC
jgi:hypothetical protein